MINKDFYPTPEEVILQMVQFADFQNKVCYDPSAGKGDIIDFLNLNGAKEVLFSEIEPDLIKICETKGRKIGEDFLKVESHQISHVDFIFMNPPYSKDETHILHAYEIAPPGCQIVALCNWETYNLARSRERIQFKILVDKHGGIENIGNAFKSAERKTNIEIGLIRLFKPAESEESEFEGYFDLTDEEEAQYNNGVMPFNEIRDIVNRYVGSVKRFDQVMRVNKEMNDIIRPISTKINVSFGVQGQGVNDRESFKKELQKAAWWTVFHKMDMRKYTTESVMRKLNNFVEKQEKIPFTMSNVKKMVEMVIGTHGDRMGRVLIEIFDWLTERYKENRKGLEGWKTNSMYFVDKKFIAPYTGIGMDSSGHPEIRWSQSGQKMDELTKALCFLTGQNYDNFEDLYSFFRPKEVYNYDAQEAIEELAEYMGIDKDKAEIIHNKCKYVDEEVNRNRFYNNFHYNLGLSKEFIDKVYDFYIEKKYPEKCWGKMYEKKEWGTWMDWGFFEIKVFKKGTMHGKFKDEKVWEMFNVACAKAKGWKLPTNTGSDVRRKTNGVEIYQD
jgi:hypothetical protein